MRKTFYYNFLPTKAEEETTVTRNQNHHVTRSLVEIRDWHPHHPPPPPTAAGSSSGSIAQPGSGRFDPNNPWTIRKMISSSEVVSGKMFLNHEEMLEHVFRYWSLEMSNYVAQGNKCLVVLIDYTEENAPKRFQGENVYVKSTGGSGDNSGYILGFKDVVIGRRMNAGDEIGLAIDTRAANYGTFAFKLLRRARSSY